MTNFEAKVEVVEPGVSTRFGSSLVGFADRLDHLANTETDLTHKQMWLTTGAAATLGAFAIATAGREPLIDPFDTIQNIITGMARKGKFLPEGTFPLSRSGFEGREALFPLLDQGKMSISDFARALIEGGLKGSSGKSVFLLDPEATERITGLLDELGHHTAKITNTERLLLLAGAGSVTLALLGSKAKEKVKVSTVALPAFAKVVREIGKLF